METKPLHILLIEPFYTGSHKAWADQFKKHSAHHIDLLTLPGKYWKWRMYGAAVTLAEKINQMETLPDLIIASDMLDLATFAGLCRSKLTNVPIALYFHENQLTYPWSSTDPDVSLQRDRTYAWKNYTSALAADHLLFNSHYHRESFLGALPEFLNGFPDFKGKENVDRIRDKAQVLHLGLDLADLDIGKAKQKIPRILWNHRWEYDKNPEDFFQLLFELQDEGLDFEVIIVGETYKHYPKIFDEAKTRLAQRILQFGYVESKEAYHQCLASADILPVTSNQDFFGISIIEAIAAGAVPILPNRLAYPEHIPADIRDVFLYQDQEELKQKLKQYLSNKPKELPSLRSHIMQYDWGHMISKYDAVCTQIVAKKEA